MKIRPARLSDIDGLLEIEEEAFRTDRLTRRKLRRLLTRGNCALLVADDGRRVAGYALLLYRRGVRGARLYGFAVRASNRSRGLGARLLRAAERSARGRRCRWLRLETDPGNERAVNLYRRMGFVLLARLGPYYEDGSPAERWLKDLTASAR